MVNLIKKLKNDLKKIKKGEEPTDSHIVFKQKIVCGDKKKVQYYVYKPKDKENKEE